MLPSDPSRPNPAQGEVVDPAAQFSYPFSYFPAIPPPLPLSLTTLPEHACSYLPGKTARSRGVWASRVPAELYRRFMDAGFRRSGKLIYQPICARCRECQSIRVPVNTFAPDKSQRRAWRKNPDITVTIAPPMASDETYALYMRYVRQWHSRESAEDSPEAFGRFLYDSPTESLEFRYRNPLGQLLAVGICDISSDALSSVYFFFDPAESQRSLGTFGALYELQYTKANLLKYYYLGYWIKSCGSMSYKARFRPCELLGADGNWVPVPPDE